MEKDTKKEETTTTQTNNNNNDDYYENEEDEYLLDEAIHGSIKNDPASKRSRPGNKYNNYNKKNENRPYFKSIWQLTLEDEDKIPKLPENILKEPDNEKTFNLKIADIDTEIEKKKKTLEELYNKITAEKTGIKKIE